MIRRSSSIENLNKSFASFENFVKIRRIKLFRSALNFKKFFTLRTRFKRRQIMRLKHVRNWLIYLNIIKYWTDEYRISKRYVRFQYKNRFFINNSIIIYGNRAIRHQGRIIHSQDQWVSSSLTAKFLRKNSYKYFSFLLSSYKGVNHLHAFYPTKEIISDLCTTPAVSIFDLHVFSKNVIEKTDKDDLENDYDIIDDFLINSTIANIIEIYKILSLHFIKLINIK